MIKMDFSLVARTIQPILYGFLRKRFDKISEDEIIRYADNTHTAFGQSVKELRKSLSRDDAQQAWFYMEEIRKGSTTLLAAMDALEDKFKGRL